MIPFPIDFSTWLSEHRDKLEPPVNNFCIQHGDDFFIMVVGGPNQRQDYHINPTDEWFYQLKGDLLLKVIDKEEQEIDLAKRFKDVWIREGEMLLLPGNIPHNPVRFADTVGLVIEMTRKQSLGHIDKLHWHCQECKKLLYEDSFFLSNVQVQLKDSIEKFYARKDLHKCQSCGHVNIFTE